MHIGGRLWLAGLLLIDRMFGTRLAINEVARRRQRLATAKAQLADIQAELKRLSELVEQANVELCLFYLRRRQLFTPKQWLFFQTTDEDEERALEMLIAHLVKSHLATVEIQEDETGYTYRLIPDWAAIRAALESQDPNLASWLEEMAEQANQVPGRCPALEKCRASQNRSGGDQWIDL